MDGYEIELIVSVHFSKCPPCPLTSSVVCMIINIKKMNKQGMIDKKYQMSLILLEMFLPLIFIIACRSTRTRDTSITYRKYPVSFLSYIFYFHRFKQANY